MVPATLPTVPGCDLASRYVPGLGGVLYLVVPCIVIFLILLFEPSGLFGRASAARS